MIDVLHVLNSLQVGGLENGVVNLINNLDHQKFSHSICCIDSVGPMAERIKKSVPIYSLEKGSKAGYLLSFKLSRIIKEINPDIIHTRNWSAIDGVIAAKLAGRKVVIHGEHGREASDPMGRNSKRKIIRKLISPWISKFIVVSNELKEWLINEVGISQSKVAQIMNGVDTDVITPEENKGLYKANFGLPSESFVIGTVGRLDPVKDHKTLLRAFSTVVKRVSDKKISLIIVGAGSLDGELKQTAEQLGIKDNICFTGRRDDVGDIYKCMDVYVLPSIAEGISNTILEAMAAGLPVISSRVGGSLELVQNEKNGFFFMPGDADGLANVISRYIQSQALAKEHGEQSRMRAVNEFSMIQMKNNYAAMYEAAVKG